MALARFGRLWIRWACDDDTGCATRRAPARATAETVNADAKAHRLSHLVVRGHDKVLSCTVLFALTYDVLRLITPGG